MQVFKGLKLKTVLPIVLFAVLMTWLLLFVLAAGPFVSIETESASISGNVEVKTDSTASAGSYLSFGTTSTGGGGNYGGLSLPVVGPRAVSCNGVTINPGDNIQSKVTANPTGTTFCIKAGTHKRQSVKPKASDKFIGEFGAILDGEKAVPFAFAGGGNNVTVENLVIKNYAPPSKIGAIDRKIDGNSSAFSGWTVRYNEVSYSSEVGIGTQTNWVVQNNYVHHNGRYGIHGGGTGALIENNEIAYNAIIYGATGDSAGTKWATTDNLIVRGNYVHHNQGNGLWTDINNLNVLYEKNISSFNTWTGIFHEISCKATIRNNYVEGNGTKDNTIINWLEGGNGIAITRSADVEVYGNTVVNNYKGIGATNGERVNSRAIPGVDKCNPEVSNLNVHDNNITHKGEGVAGISASYHANEVYNQWNNRFKNNTYNVDSTARWRWDNTWLTNSQWKNLGLN
jgi:hypothetical protein